MSKRRGIYIFKVEGEERRGKERNGEEERGGGEGQAKEGVMRSSFSMRCLFR